jgi:dTDP-4-amino-4,6-dideoxygalactose transaminase
MTLTSVNSENYLAKFFSKNYGKFLFSGTLALETALIASEIKPGDTVLIPNHVCYRVLLSLRRLGAMPLIVTPSNGYCLTPSDLEPVVNKYQIKAIILVHHLGLPVDILAIKKICQKETVIIEDASQAWDIQSKGKPVGMFSDYVVTSFGASKPLSFGIGGGIFGDKIDFLKLIDNYTSDSRTSKRVLLPYALPESAGLDVNRLIKVGNKAVDHQRKVADILCRELADTKLNYWHTSVGDKPSWHRFPIWTEDRTLFDLLVAQADKLGICYEIPYKVWLSDTPLANGSIVVKSDNLDKKYYHFLVKTRSNLLINIRKWIKTIR